MAVTLAALPQGIQGNDLVLAINDRLRRISGFASAVVIAPASVAPVAPAELNQVFVTSTPYPVSGDDDVVTFETGSAVANMPDLSTVRRHEMWFINASASTVTLNAFAGDTIEGNASLSLTRGSRYQLVPNA